MEEEKAKRRRKKREVQKNIQGIEKWVYDPITGQKVKKKAEQIAVKQYNILDNNAVGSLDFKSSDGMQQSRVADMAQRSNKSRKKSMKKLQGMDSVPKQTQPMVSSKSDPVSPPPNPMASNGGGPPPVPQPAPGVVGAVPPPVPNAMNRATTEPGVAVPPPVPGVGGGGPPPAPMMQQQQQQRRPLTPQEMAERSRNAALESNAYRPATTQPAAVQQQQPAARPPNPFGGGGNSALLAGIRNRNVKLKSAPAVERKPRKLEGRDALMANLRKGAVNLKKVEKKEEKEPETEEIGRERCIDGQLTKRSGELEKGREERRERTGTRESGRHDFCDSQSTTV